MPEMYAASPSRLAEAFSTHGFVKLSAAIPPSALRIAQTVSAELIADRRRRLSTARNGSDGWQAGPFVDGRPTLFRLNGPWLHHRLEFAGRLLATRRVLDAVRELMEGDAAAPIADALVFKDAYRGFGHRWHRDPSPIDMFPSLIVGFHFDSSDADSGGLMFVPGSHRSLDTTDWNALPKADWFAARPDVVEMVTEAGDVVIHSTRVIHCSHPTRQASLRRIYYVQFDRMEKLGRIPEDARWRPQSMSASEALRQALEQFGEPT
jgi:ectoine hydroxylase-related dioxygenase (phytanoyl-CoA dioxygenase family)